METKSKTDADHLYTLFTKLAPELVKRLDAFGDAIGLQSRPAAALLLIVEGLRTHEARVRRAKRAERLARARGVK